MARRSRPRHSCWIWPRCSITSATSRSPPPGPPATFPTPIGRGPGQWRLLGRCAAARADRANARERTGASHSPRPPAHPRRGYLVTHQRAAAQYPGGARSACTTCSTRRRDRPLPLAAGCAAGPGAHGRADMVTTADLVDAKLCQKPAAKKYLEALAQAHGWQIVTARPAGAANHRWHV